MFDHSNTTISSVDDILDIETVGGFRVWHLISVVSSSLLLLVTCACCCVTFRIPRTKQEIEADYIRKQITCKFRKRLNSIPDSEMEEMSLIKAVEKLRFDLLPKEDKLSLLKSNNNIENTREIASAIRDEPQIPHKNKYSKNESQVSNLYQEKNEASSGFSSKFVTIVHAFGMFWPRRSFDDENLRQMKV